VGYCQSSAGQRDQGVAGAVLPTSLFPFDESLGRGPSLLLTAPSHVARAFNRHAAASSTRRSNGVAEEPIHRTYPKYVTVQSWRHLRAKHSKQPGLFTIHHYPSRPDITSRDISSLAIIPESHIPVCKSVSRLESAPSAASTSAQHVAQRAQLQYWPERHES
jgi:hypothetical protein